MELFRVTGEGVGTVATGRGVATVGIVHYQRECRAPCDASILEPGADFFIGGDGIQPSKRFSLLGHGEDVTLHVDPGSSALRSLAWTALALGVSAALVGGGLIAYASSEDSGNSLNASSDSSRLKTHGWAALIGGGLMTGAGVSLFAFSSTDVEFLPSSAPGKRRVAGQGHVVTRR
ncbi:hypothetical protein [Hyalangium gracile]|uniref:hypothetical protein n=1 Tax=Hyalangium gracile TaxID=394092 RepID=UPI001CC9068F|nr:hypothetical protein [Hyalangium gracile]